MQIGTAAVDLQSLLRQGREFAELLVEVPIMDQSCVATEMGASGFAGLAAGPGGAKPRHILRL